MGELAYKIFSSVIRPPWPVSTISIKAAEAALEDRAYVDERIATTLKLRKEFAKSLSHFSQFRVLPSETNFFLVNIEGTRRNSTELSQLLEEDMIFVRDCSSFGKILEGRYIRDGPQLYCSRGILFALEILIQSATLFV
jgi:histidinol-phosphate/aromatic aminotransferase/cobyric acid decarboxylase-like protein